ncbi:HNH endonuclease [Peribacillus asahii]|uniref:HNH endonuclease n=1 Tax=Peribacillus asahii TaxID=228899 RepID=UPI00207A4E99|nr:HNH endonuclease signature motif containing protein [Peribacillus asahii]USK86154.1 HNH endonuclease [Peribacillus asahii]
MIIILRQLQEKLNSSSEYSLGLLTIKPFDKGNLKSITFLIDETDDKIKFSFKANKPIIKRIVEISNYLQEYYSNFKQIDEASVEFAQIFNNHDSLESIADAFNLFYARIMDIAVNSQNLVIHYQGSSYIFTEKRAIHAFSILKDLEWHSRTEIEGIQEDGTRTYGDPSRTVTVLEECGFEIERGYTTENGQRMQQYKLNSLNQDVANIKRRTTITKKMRLQVFERDNFRCAICQNTFEEAFLEPDHKTPIQIQGDEIDLSDSNWMDKLQTMCKICNGRKREVCKKCVTLDCDNCPWCHPEELLESFVRLPSTVYKIALERAEQIGESVESYLASIIVKKDESD